MSDGPLAPPACWSAGCAPRAVHRRTTRARIILEQEVRAGGGGAGCLWPSAAPPRPARARIFEACVADTRAQAGMTSLAERVSAASDLPAAQAVPALLACVEDAAGGPEAVKAKEEAVAQLGACYVKAQDGEAIRRLLATLRPIFASVSSATARWQGKEGRAPKHGRPPPKEHPARRSTTAFRVCNHVACAASAASAAVAHP